MRGHRPSFSFDVPAGRPVGAIPEEHASDPVGRAAGRRLDGHLGSRVETPTAIHRVLLMRGRESPWRWRRRIRNSPTGSSARRRLRRPGRLVAVVGPDGVGKTTLAGHVARLWNGPTSYVHFLPPIRGELDAAPADHALIVPKAPKRGSLALGLIRLARNFVRFWAGYLTTCLPRLRRGELILADRWCFGYIAQPYALRFYGPDWVARLAVRLMPRPDLVVNLHASPAVIRSRKAELSVEEIEIELASWRSIPVNNMLSLDADTSPLTLARAVLDRINESRRP